MTMLNDTGLSLSQRLRTTRLMAGLEQQDMADRLPRCGCGRWETYMGSYDADGYTLRCHGCLRAIGRCTCG